MVSLTRTRAALAFLGVLLVAGSTASPVRSATVLRWQLKQGTKFSVEMQQKTTQIVTTAGKTMEIPQTMVMQMTWSVESVDEKGVARVTQVIDRITMSMQPPGQAEVKFDSASGEAPTGFAEMLASALKAMVGATITQTMNDRGKVLDVTVPEATLKMAETNPALKFFFSKDALKDLMAKASPEFPEEAIERGYRWKSDIEAQSPIGQMKIHSTYTYMGKEKRGDRELDRIGIVMEMEIEGSGQLGAKVTIVEQENTGDAYFDSGLGYFAASEMTQKMKMEVVVGSAVMQQSIATTQRLTVTPALATPAAPAAPAGAAAPAAPAGAAAPAAPAGAAAPASKAAPAEKQP